VTNEIEKHEGLQMVFIDIYDMCADIGREDITLLVMTDFIKIKVAS
jgi:hypothetical protein